MIRKLRQFIAAPFQLVLVISFSLIAAISIGIGAWAISSAISDYLLEAMNERIARDMQLAETFYALKLGEMQEITECLSNDSLVVESLKSSPSNGQNIRSVINQQIANQHSIATLGGNHAIAILDQDGRIVAGQLITSEGQLRTLPPDESLNALELIPQSMASGEKIASTEILSADILEKFGLEEQAKISIIDTPRASPDLFDDREGSAGLTMISVSPIRNRSGSIIGSAVALHLLNNDFTLVDQIREVASIDTATIFFGDLRITTNVLDSQGNRAIGTRVSQEVSDIVLQQGRQFIGPAFVVNEEYITRYDPLKNHLGDVTGILYVGAKQASFQRLVRNFNRQISLVAIGTVLLTIIITTPVSRAITRPLDQLKVLVAANRRVAQGDMSVRVPVRAGGEVGLLEYSFNSMLDTLQTTQDQLVQSEKLASVGQLAAGVAHELNNPLGTILLYSDILSKELDSDSPYQDDIVLIIKETKRCKGIVSALLEFARQNQVVAEPTDINVMVKEVVELQLHQHTLGARIQVVYELDPGLPEIQADRAQLHQVLVNLIDNAIDAMPEGGKLTLRSHPGPSGMVTIVVEDTGIGIPAENISKLFTPFFTTKPTGKGTGLGLAIVYGIIKLHRGQINVASEVMQGTKFTIQLPIKLQAVSRTGLASNAFVRERNDTG